MKLCIVAGARPNFMKIAPIISAIKKFNNSINPSERESQVGRAQGVDEIDPINTSNAIDSSNRINPINSMNPSNPINYILVHTGQHYDEKMSKFFFDDLEIPTPDINLEVGSASHAAQVAEIMVRFERVCLNYNPTHLLVVGDVNSTIACALVASKMGIKVVHVEAGLRSFDRSMPEEINRVLTDAISDVLFTTEESANKNLRNEGILEQKIHFVGNVMIDTLLKHKKKAGQSNILYSLGLIDTRSRNSNKSVNPYAALTLHRPSNVDDRQTFEGIIEALIEVSMKIQIVFPTHPRTVTRIKEFGFGNYFKWVSGPDNQLLEHNHRILCTDPFGYLDFLQLMSHAKLVLTDSGGIQEETTILSIPCVTIRENTERPVTVMHGTNVIAGVRKEKIVEAAFSQLDRPVKSLVPPLWDGKAAERIVKIIIQDFYGRDEKRGNLGRSVMTHY
jgi:UDP-N-acetylglucosamine 2-epimerase (non-hydrolysing)